MCFLTPLPNLIGPSLSSISGIETVIVLADALELICLNLMSAVKDGAEIKYDFN